MRNKQTDINTDRHTDKAIHREAPLLKRVCGLDQNKIICILFSTTQIFKVCIVYTKQHINTFNEKIHVFGNYVPNRTHIMQITVL